MSGTTFTNVTISGVAAAVPKKSVENRSYGNIFGDDTVDKFINLTGVETLHKAERCQTAGDLGYVAAEKLLSEFDVDRNEIGAVIFVTGSPDYYWPSTANVLHYRLGLSHNCLAFDINLGCSGFVYGVHLCSSLLQTMDSKYALLINGQADKLQNFLDREKPDDSMVMMFGDAATAVLLERRANSQPINTELFSDGSGYKMLIRGGMCRSVDESKAPTRWSDGIDRSIEDPYMDGMGVFQFSTKEAPKAILGFTEKFNQELEGFDYVFLHQANRMIIERISKKLKIKSPKVPLSLTKYGNTASATIPLTIAQELGPVSNEEITALMCGFGVGLSWGVVSATISADIVLPIIETDDYYKDGELFTNCYFE